MSSFWEKENHGDDQQVTPISVLVVSDSDEQCDDLRHLIDAAGMNVVTCPSMLAPVLLAQRGPDVALLCMDWDSPDLLAASHRLRPDTPILVAGGDLDSAQLIRLFRAGASDFVQMPCPPGGLVERLRAASNAGTDAKKRGQRLERLRKICRKLTDSKHEIASRLDTLESEFEACRSDVSAQLNVTAAASEFRALVSQELAVEDVLRTALEYVLSKTGPTNGAVFLATAESEFSLGAYVNFECSRELADPMLGRFATDVCPHLADEDELIRFQDVQKFVDSIGPEAEILQNSEVVALPCSFDGECMGVMVLFRDKSEPFSDEIAPVLDEIREIFGEQLAAIVRIHHRLQPEWPAESAEDIDDNIDWGFGDAA